MLFENRDNHKSAFIHTSGDGTAAVRNTPSSQECFYSHWWGRYSWRAKYAVIARVLLFTRVGTVQLTCEIRRHRKSAFIHRGGDGTVYVRNTPSSQECFYSPGWGRYSWSVKYTVIIRVLLFTGVGRVQLMCEIHCHHKSAFIHRGGDGTGYVRNAPSSQECCYSHRCGRYNLSK